ncbi:MAG: 4Fe-4S dicluster domain-containing protein, partial [Candidatus Cloacimonetes bacterium]|nr:4Fe-4S dicluster domain-containing protein [Candidatus Cloacimonadota bacterium]
HFMESWGDARAYDGTTSLIQPLIRRMYDSISIWELVAAFAGDERPDGHRLVRERYANEATAAGLLAWQQHLQLGLVPGTAFPAQQVTAGRGAAPPPPAMGSAFEVSFEESQAVYDGRFASNSWLQELPKPHTKLTWGNAAVLSPATARELGVGTEDVVRIVRGAWHVDAPVYVLPGHADRCVSLELGYGRSAGGPVAEGVGVNAYVIRPPGPAGYASAVQIVSTGGTRRLAPTQKEFDQHGRDIARHADLAFYQAQPQFTAAQRGPLPSWLPDHFEDVPKWGMTIDTMICTGCSSCVIACQADNNIPVVGKKGVIDDREMHWLRIDTYREERGEDVEFIHQPMLCQHCEDAPCEYVCPVYATQHSPDGLNEMVYNRCIGTRFCSNNCPYKVRRFNWFDYTEDTPKTKQLQFNPNVTVRARGVMEKCTFCVQRIRAAGIEARKDRREIRPNEVMTACQQACPTGAIQFGLLHHEGTNVVEWRKEPRAYAVLHDLGTRPRTIYLAKITNPNPEVGER